MTDCLAAVYDFELMPYALGDVLTWNVQAAIRARELGRTAVDIMICLDRRYPSSIYQRGLVTDRNCELFFSELFGAFGTQPLLRDIHVFRRRETLLAALAERAKGDAACREALDDYTRTLGQRDDENALNAYFIKYIYSHERINHHAAQHGDIPLLVPSIGCEPDIDGLMDRYFADRRIVVIHPRLRRLDLGYAGDHTYSRDSDFLEWFDFLREAERRHPEVQFVVVGRLQEKPLEVLALPNVTSLRPMGLGLGHELTLLARCDLFIGTSSGFAAMANFCTTPYFVTRMNRESCKAYCIPEGCDRLPFARPHQTLVYDEETSGLLLDLLAAGLAIPKARPDGARPASSAGIDVGSFVGRRSAALAPGATTGRFDVSLAEADRETAFLLAPRLAAAGAQAEAGNRGQAARVLRRVEANFPRLRNEFAELMALRAQVSPAPPGTAAEPAAVSATPAVVKPSPPAPVSVGLAVRRLAHRASAQPVLRRVAVTLLPLRLRHLLRRKLFQEQRP